MANDGTVCSGRSDVLCTMILLISLNEERIFFDSRLFSAVSSRRGDESYNAQQQRSTTMANQGKNLILLTILTSVLLVWGRSFTNVVSTVYRLLERTKKKHED